MRDIDNERAEDPLQMYDYIHAPVLAGAVLTARSYE